MKRINDAVASKIDAKTVMMNIENGQYSGLNIIGSRIRELMKTPVKVSEPIDTLQKIML